MGDVREPISDSSSRRPRPSVVERWESAISRSRPSVVERWESAISRSRARSPPPQLPRARTLVRLGSTSTVPTSEPAPAPAPAPAPPKSSPDSSSVVGNVTVESFSAFDCSICYLPLKSPIFQCTVGHVVCSTCHDKLKLRLKATQCHVCRAPTTPGGYSRCHAMEHVVDSIRLPCPHAAHGCAKRPAYHDHEAHAVTCPHRHKPCHCPGDGCGFAGPSLTTLLVHFAKEHGWPFSAGSTGPRGSDVRLRKGFNVVVFTFNPATTTEDQYTLVLNVEQAAPVCNAITAFCIHRSYTGTVRFDLSYNRRCPDSGLCSSYKQELNVVCMDLSNGLPAGPSSYGTFLEPSWSGSASAPGGEDEDDHDIRVTVSYIPGT